jgi:hypothetical protein
MPILMDKILAESADQAYETARLGRNGVHRLRDRVSAEMSIELEAAGDAMRYLNSYGRIAWKATSQLRNYLMDLQLDAEADLADLFPTSQRTLQQSAAGCKTTDIAARLSRGDQLHADKPSARGRSLRRHDRFLELTTSRRRLREHPSSVSDDPIARTRRVSRVAQ